MILALASKLEVAAPMRSMYLSRIAPSSSIYSAFRSACGSNPDETAHALEIDAPA